MIRVISEQKPVLLIVVCGGVKMMTIRCMCVAVTWLYTVCNVFLWVAIRHCLSAWRQRSTGRHLRHCSHSGYYNVSVTCSSI